MYLGDNILENFYFLKIYSIAVKLFSPRRECFSFFVFLSHCYIWQIFSRL